MTTRTPEYVPAPATADVMRMVPLQAASLRAEEDGGEGRTLVGYAAVFNRWTEIDSWWEGHFMERIAPGAFANTLAKRGDRVKVLFNHGFDPSIGDKPLGKPARLEEDDTGLWTETPLARTSYNDDLIELLRSGAIDGMSFRFRVTEEEWKDDPEPSEDNPRGLPERTIKAVDLLEFGPVTFPAYEATSAGVRSADVFRVWQQTRGFLLPQGAGPQATAEGETNDDDSRAEEPPVAEKPPVDDAAVRRRLAQLKEMTTDGS
jgi:HK97 family phage prohead protease